MKDKIEIKVRPVFAWYDFWIGAYWDRKNQTLYIFPVPMIGVQIEFVRRGTKFHVELMK
jgi:hypothetical protein